MHTVLMINAMAEEQAGFNKHLSVGRERVVGAFCFMEYQYLSFSLITTCCGIGKVNAAACTALGISLYQPDLVINSGVAGGLVSELAVGDVIIGTEFSYHDADATAFGYAYGQIPRMPLFYQASLVINQLIMDSLQLASFNVLSGLICSGDSFIADHEKVLAIQAKIPAILALDMESCAIAQACHQLQVPFSCLRSISDAANTQATQSYEACLVIAVDHVTQVLVDFLQHYHVVNQARV